MLKKRLSLLCVSVFGLSAALVGCTGAQSGSTLWNSDEQPSIHAVNSIRPSSAKQLLPPLKMVDASAGGFHYAYAPVIIKVGETYHSYFCSHGTGDLDWDNIRYSTSSDLLNWSAPVTLLSSTQVERANCDPSIVRFDAGDGPYYYLFYSGNAVNIQTLNFVARSKEPGGPFLKLTDRRTWEPNPHDPRAIVWPSRAGNDDKSNIYGAGQPAVVVRDGVLYQWYNDTTSDLPARQVNRVFLRLSRNAIDWSDSIATNVYEGSVDVKFDPASNRFVMFELRDAHQKHTSITMRTSVNGIQWDEGVTICDDACTPDWSNNIGASGDDRGYLGDRVMLAFGAPHDLHPAYNNDCKIAAAPYCWGNWDLYGILFELKRSSPTSFDVVGVLKRGAGTQKTEVHTLAGETNFSSYNYHMATALSEVGGDFEFHMADFDRDGVLDLIALKRQGTGTRSTEVHILSGASGYQTFLLHVGTPVPELPSSSAQFEFTDWDHDGVADLAFIHTSGSGSGRVDLHVLSGASNYQTFIHHAVTVYDQVGAESAFRLEDWDSDGVPDLISILRRPINNTTEVHVASGAKGFQSFLVHAVSALSAVPADAVLDLKDWNRDGRLDLVAVVKSQTGSKKTEVHVFSGQDLGSGPFKTPLLQTGTVAPETGDEWDYIVVPR